MKIVLVIPSMGSGGAERVLSILVNQWAKKSDCLVNLIILSRGPVFYDIDPRVSVHKLGYVGGGGWIAKFSGALCGGLKFRRFIKSNQPDVVLSFIREANIFTLFFTRYLGVKVVISERDSAKAVVGRLYSYLRRLTYPWADGIVVQSEHYKNSIEEIIGFAKAKVKVIHNPVKKIENRQVPKEPIVVNVGRLIREKGQLYLLRAFKETKCGSDWRLVILGDGALKSDLVAEADRLQILDRVDFIGATKDVDYWLNISSIFAFSSVSEGFPNALAEAMSAGLPCVSFNCIAGPSDLITDGVDGFLVDVGDIALMANRLDELMSSADLREKLSNAARLVAKKLDAEKISEEYYSFLLLV